MDEGVNRLTVRLLGYGRFFVFYFSISSVFEVALFVFLLLVLLVNEGDPSVVWA